MQGLVLREDKGLGLLFSASLGPGTGATYSAVGIPVMLLKEEKEGWG